MCFLIKPFLKDVVLKRHFYSQKSVRLERDFQIREVQREWKLVFGNAWYLGRTVWTGKSQKEESGAAKDLC